MATKKETATFEENIKQIEDIVKALEGGDASLEEMLSLFEEGVGLTKLCSNQLKNAEQKISVLMKNAEGDIVQMPFEEQ